MSVDFSSTENTKNWMDWKNYKKYNCVKNALTILQKLDALRLSVPFNFPTRTFNVQDVILQSYPKDNFRNIKSCLSNLNFFILERKVWLLPNKSQYFAVHCSTLYPKALCIPCYNQFPLKDFRITNWCFAIPPSNESSAVYFKPSTECLLYCFTQMKIMQD